MWRLTLCVGLAMVVAGCRAALTPQALQTYQSRTLYTCCNIHYESGDINDANYYVGTTLPAGTGAHVDGAGRDSITFSAGGVQLTLAHKYGTDQESFQQYIDKVLVAEDPKARLATYPRAVQDAVREGRVEKGMTREQVLLSLGYPPTHRTPSLTLPEWTYWYNRWVTYKVQFDADGRVSNVIGRPAPTQDQPIPVATAAPAAPARPPASKKRR